MSDSSELPPVPNTPPIPQTPPPPAGAGQPNNNVLMLILSYLGLLALIPLLVEKNDREVQWHAKHGLVLFAAEFIVCTGLSILGFIPVIGCAIYILLLLICVGILVLHVICILKATKGERLIIPQLSVYADKF